MHFGLASSSKEKLMEGNERRKGGEWWGGGQRHVMAKVKAGNMGDYNTIISQV